MIKNTAQKTLAGLIVASCLFASGANAKIATRNEFSPPPQSQQLVEAINTLYPGIDVQIASPAPEDVLVYELYLLRDMLAEGEVQPGELIHLVTCPKRDCGR